MEDKKENQKEDCIFCKIVNGEIESKKVYDDDNFIGILDANPLSEGHTLIIPKKHFRNLLDMPSSLGNELLEAVKKVSLDLIKNGKAEGINVLANNEPVSGQIVFHAHVHVFPRKEGDGIKVMEK
ncbi:HIT family protein [archaeon]|jgi:histidine triad (HIT) family protein|nr:HIT family protein [archaeon]MBT4241783.1 HIT family protein [archaeon]MBT4418331.1 HIT family protein [archaeon]